MKKTISLTDKDKYRLKLLAEMIDAGANEFSRDIKIDALSRKQFFLYLNFAAVNNYSEAVYKLCSDMRPFAASVILRSIVEAFINMGYLLSHNSDKRCVLFSMEGSYYKRSLSNEIIAFFSKHHQFEKGRFNIASFKKAIKKVNREIDLYKKNHGFQFNSKKDFEKEYHTNLLERARVADRRFKNPIFEHTYILAYRYFSEYAHLKAVGLNHFVKEYPNHYEMMAGQYNEVGHIIGTVMTIYIYFLSELKKRKMLRKSFPFKKFDRVWNEEFNKKKK
jgi:hypothetical protein